MSRKKKNKSKSIWKNKLLGVGVHSDFTIPESHVQNISELEIIGNSDNEYTRLSKELSDKRDAYTKNPNFLQKQSMLNEINNLNAKLLSMEQSQPHHDIRSQVGNYVTDIK